MPLISYPALLEAYIYISILRVREAKSTHAMSMCI